MSSADEEDDIFLADNASGDEMMLASSDSDFEDVSAAKKKKKQAAKRKTKAAAVKAAVGGSGAGQKRKRGKYDNGDEDSGDGSEAEEDNGPERTARTRTSNANANATGRLFSDDDRSGSDEENLYTDDEEFGMRRLKQITGSAFLTKLLGRKARPVKDLGGLELKGDHGARPLWIDNHGRM